MNSTNDFDHFLLELEQKIAQHPKERSKIIRQEIKKTGSM